VRRGGLVPVSDDGSVPARSVGEPSVTEAELLIRNQLGLHARACALFVKTAAKFTAEVFVSRDDLEVNGKSIMGVMMLAAEEGSTIRVRAEGPDEQEAVAALRALVDGKFGGEP
jgi:phosphocarrier protein